jgi:D-alanyl-D-alanine carboxypeptidase (penicillin-binding protein 5/6)
MVYKRKSMYVLIALFIAIFLPLSVLAQGSPVITADAFLLVEKDSLTVLAGKDYHRQLPPASTTKVLTSIVALERLREGDVIVPTRKVLALPNSKLNLVPGRSYRAMDLVTGALVKSGNDAAFALSEAIGGSEERFADMMNQKAMEIGAEHSNFRNASGLSAPGQYTSCWDLALILRYALDNPRFREIIQTKYFLFNNGQRDVRYRNHNRLLFCFEPSVGGKTGFTRASMHTYVGAFEKDGKVYILSMLKSRNLWGDAVNILKYVYSDVPTDREIHLARASAVTLTSYKVKKPATKLASKKTKKDHVKLTSNKAKKHKAILTSNKAKKRTASRQAATRKNLKKTSKYESSRIR